MQQKHLDKLTLEQGQVQSGWMMYSVMVLSNNLDSAYKQAGAIITVIIVKMLVLSAPVSNATNTYVIYVNSNNYKLCIYYQYKSQLFYASIDNTFKLIIMLLICF